MPARDVVARLKARELAPSDLIDISLARLAEVEPKVNACPILCEARARKAAKDLGGDTEHPGWLAGLPLPIKDLSGVAGVRSTWGTKGLSDFVPEVSDPIVTRLEDRGGIVLAKSNTPEFGAGANTFNSVFGPTLNPWNTKMNAAGSSGGAAVSLATGAFWLAHGSDHAGSLRTPAAFNRVVGLRPSPGRVPAGGALSFVREGVQGPMARDVLDCALFLDAMAGFDPADPLSYPAPPTSFLQTASQERRDISISYAPTLGGYAPVEAEIREIMDSAMHALERAGARIADECPDIAGLEPVYRSLRGALWATSVGRAPAEITDHIKATLRENTAFGQALTLQDLGDAELGRARIFANLSSHLERFDVLATAVVGCPPKPQEVEYPRAVDGVPMEDYISWLKFAFLATTCGMPALSLPIGFTKEGLPVGLQLIGPYQGEAKLLQIARFVEATLGLDLAPMDPITP